MKLHLVIFSLLIALGCKDSHKHDHSEHGHAHEHSHDHDHGHEHDLYIDENSAHKLGMAHLSRLINVKKIDPSWSKNEFVSAAKPEGEKWVVLFTNKAKKSNLKIHLSLDGRFKDFELE